VTNIANNSQRVPIIANWFLCNRAGNQLREPKAYAITTKKARWILGPLPHILDKYSPNAKNVAEIKSQTIAGMERRIFILPPFYQETASKQRQLSTIYENTWLRVRDDVRTY